MAEYSKNSAIQIPQSICAAFNQRVKIWLAVIAFTLIFLALQERMEWFVKYPAELALPFTEILNIAMGWFVSKTTPLFRAITWLLEYPMTWMRDLLHWLPWPVLIAISALISHRAGGWKLTIFTATSLFYMLVVGYWEESMNSLALIAVSVPLAVLTGFVIGVWGYTSRRAERVIMPTLDLLQTIPAFAYLLPILLLFGFGPVVGLIASLLYSFPPMVRNTIVGLRGVPTEIVESGLMSGATPQQLFWLARIPTALRQILLGVNQTTMASLSMVIVASIIGGTSDIGWEVLSTMRKAQFGESLLAGIVIALMAMILDRITWGIATRDSNDIGEQSWFTRYRYWVMGTLVAVILMGLSRFIPALLKFPETWIVYPAASLNDALQWIVINFQPLIETVKTTSLFFFMLPLRVGLDQTVTPYTWGFELTLVHSFVYLMIVLAAAAVAFRYVAAGVAIAIVLFGIIFYVGLTDMPWPALAIILVIFGHQLGGWRLALGTFSGVAFLLFAGMWDKAMLSLYLLGVAVSVSFLIGTFLGTWAAHNEYVSRTMRPINDTLQTMPLFVILIPIVMIFKIGEFTALLAIIAYAYVPAFRYTEHGLRNVSKEVLEAARSMGCTPAQLLWQVKLPLALPNIMLGLNQTIMYGISMLVIAALVGTNGLGQEVYIGLSKGDFGIGMVAGAGMAIIAIVADRMCQAWKHKYETRIAT